MPTVRILLLADSHIGLDMPLRPRIARRRRGDDFLANHTLALAPALRGEVDLVVHGGDVFHRPRIDRDLAFRAYAPLLRVAEAGVPVFIVPGNHEGARLPHSELLRAANLHVFDRPRTFTIEVRGARVALSGFPFIRDVRAHFRPVVAESGWQDQHADLRLLCVHHCVEGATVGPGNFTFTTARDVIRGRDIPAGCAAVLSGHIHRRQVLTTTLAGRPLAAPVLYPGSVERASAAEIGETKGFMILEADAGDAAAPVRWECRDLYARPMQQHRLMMQQWSTDALMTEVRALVSAAPPDAVLQIRIEGDVSAADLRVLSAAHLRSFVAATQNLEIRVPEVETAPREWVRHRRKPPAAPAAPAVDDNLQLDL
jgi:DNA repair exonuclease SbcCD nuclease subunit